MADVSGILSVSRSIAGEKTSPEMRKIWDYLYQLTEELRYCFLHLDEENVSDALREKWAKMAKTASTYVNQQDVSEAVEKITRQINGAEGGHVVLRMNGDGQPTELLIMDTDDLETANQVWRWNAEGLGHSSTGIEGPFTTAITQDGQILADFITTGSLSAQVISAFVQLIAGDAAAQHLHLGCDEYLDPFLRLYDAEGVCTVNLTADGLRFQSRRIRPVTIGSKNGIGIFIGGNDG